MSRLTVAITFSCGLLMILGIGFLAIQGWPVEAASSTVRVDQDKGTTSSTQPDSFTPTPTPITSTHLPDFPACPSGFKTISTFNDYLRRDVEPYSHSYPIFFADDGIILLQGWVMEGHPDRGCPGHPDCDDIQDHEDIIFEMDGDILGTYEDSEHRPYENAWYFFGPMTADLNSGSHRLTFRHTMHSEDAGSVGYRFSLCGTSLVLPTTAFTPTSTFTPSPESTSTHTQAASATPTVHASSTPETVFTPTPTNTSQPLSGLVIFGTVQVEESRTRLDERGLAEVSIHLAFASYPGKVVAVTDKEGRYRSEFLKIPVDETIRVWATKDGYEFQPELETWRFYAGYYQENQIDFTAYEDMGAVTPITPTSTIAPTFTPAPTFTLETLEPNC